MNASIQKPALKRNCLDGIVLPPHYCRKEASLYWTPQGNKIPMVWIVYDKATNQHIAEGDTIKQARENARRVLTSHNQNHSMKDEPKTTDTTNPMPNDKSPPEPETAPQHDTGVDCVSRLVGLLVFAGDLEVNGDEISGCAVDIDRTTLKAAKSLPMYQRCVIVTADELQKMEAVIDAAKCIRHWHDREPDGMIVSAEHVRKLWAALHDLEANRQADT
jgi:hypothetical protein